MSATDVIVLPIDFSEQSQASLPWARRMAAVTGAELHCIYSVEAPHIYSALDMAPAVPLPTAEELAETAETQLQNFIAQHLSGEDIKTVSVILTGNPSEQIIAYANEVNAAMIIMSTHGYSGLSHVLLGSTTEDVLRHASCPVLVVREPGD